MSTTTTARRVGTVGQGTSYHVVCSDGFALCGAGTSNSAPVMKKVRVVEGAPATCRRCLSIAGSTPEPTTEAPAPAHDVMSPLGQQRVLADLRVRRLHRELTDAATRLRHDMDNLLLRLSEWDPADLNSPVNSNGEIQSSGNRLDRLVGEFTQARDLWHVLNNLGHDAE